MLNFFLNALCTLKEAIRAPFLFWFDATGWVWFMYDVVYEMLEPFCVFILSMTISVALILLIESLFSHFIPKMKASYKNGTSIKDFCSWFKISSSSLIAKINSFINQFHKK